MDTFSRCKDYTVLDLIEVRKRATVISWIMPLAPQSIEISEIHSINTSSEPSSRLCHLLIPYTKPSISLHQLSTMSPIRIYATSISRVQSLKKGRGSGLMKAGCRQSPPSRSNRDLKKGNQYKPKDAFIDFFEGESYLRC